MRPVALPEADWLGLCRRAAHAAREAVAAFSTTAERSVQHGRGEGGDTTLAVDKAAEDAVFAELEAFGVPLMAVSEERGELAVGGGSDGVRVVIDPVDGSVNAKRALPFACVSIAVARGRAWRTSRSASSRIWCPRATGGRSAARAPSATASASRSWSPGRSSCSGWRPRGRSASRPRRTRSPPWGRAACERWARSRPRCAWWPRAASTRWSPCARSARWTWRRRS